MRATGAGTLSPYEPWQALMLEADFGRFQQPGTLRHLIRECFHHGRHLFWAHQCRAREMKPARGFPLAIRVGPSFAKAQLTLGDGITATTTLGAPARGRLDRIRHGRDFGDCAKTPSSFAQAFGD